jgi:adenosylhomocysteine nucleosidase
LSRPGIVAALAAEARLLGPARPHGAALALADGTLLVVSGMGPSAAANAAQRLLEAGATALVSFGVAGGLDPALEVGMLVLPREVISSDGARHATAQEWRERVAAAVADRYPACHGALLTCREPLFSPADKATAFCETGAAAVDMEGFAIAEVAAGRGLPFLAVRSVLDAAADTLPPTLLRAIDARGGASLGRVLGALARAPREWPDVLRLARRCRAAARPLVAVARSGTLASPAPHPQTAVRPRTAADPHSASHDGTVGVP